MSMVVSPTVLVTGGAGYIGSHVVLALVDTGYRVVVVDNLICGHRELVDGLSAVEFINGDIRDRALLDRVFAQRSVHAVMHLSAHAYVGESVRDPAKYYQNNVSATLVLLDAMMAADVPILVFSSTCATYGVPNHIPITEDMVQCPVNPYGRSKLMVERVLADYAAAYGLCPVVFRYFNVAGADPSGRAGELHDPETHLVPLVLQAAREGCSCINVFGTDYDTPDGTCVRDYIHVGDVARAHVLGLDHALKTHQGDSFNLGNGAGYSVRDVIKAAEHVTGLPVKVVETQRRPGDPPVLVGSGTKARDLLGWSPQYPDMETMLQHSWRWLTRGS
jgi:UDP-glucose 4-epimerase